MQTIPAGEFKTHCLKIMDQVAKNHEEMIITKRGVPIAKLVPIETNDDPFGFLKDSIQIKEDIIYYNLEQWDVEKE